MNALRIVVASISFILAFSNVSLAQQAPKISWTGMVGTVQLQTIHAHSGPQGTLTNLTITLAPKAKVWKKTACADFSAVRVGDEVFATGYRVATGELLATEVWVNLASFYGLITDVSANEFQVLLYMPEPDGRTQTVIADGDTLEGGVSPLRRPEIQKGRFVQVVGSAMPDRKVGATSVVLYVNHRQIDPPPKRSSP